MSQTSETLEKKLKECQDRADTLQEILNWTMRQHRLIRALHSENQDSYYKPECNECITPYPCSIIKILDKLI